MGSSSSDSSDSPSSSSEDAKKKAKKKSSSSDDSSDSSSEEKAPAKKVPAKKKSSSSDSSDSSSSSSSDGDDKKKKSSEESDSSSSESSEKKKPAKKKEKSDKDSKKDTKKRPRESSDTDESVKAEEESKHQVKKQAVTGSKDNELFVGSLPFGTTEQELKALFSEEGDNILRVSVLKNGGAAFITFENAEAAKKNLKWDGSQYKGRNLRVNLAGDKPAPGARSPGGNSGGRRNDANERTIFIGGLPFGTTENDVKELFKGEGNIERCATIKDGACAFVAFSTIDEAKNNLKWDGSKYNGRSLRVNMAGEKPAGK